MLSLLIEQSITDPRILCSFFLLILTKSLVTDISSLSYWNCLTQERESPSSCLLPVLLKQSLPIHDLVPVCALSRQVYQILLMW